MTIDAARRTLSDEEKEQFAYELALGYFDDEGLCTRFDILPSYLPTLKDMKVIRRLVIKKKREIDESDQAIRILARRAARIAIENAAKIIEDEDAPAKTRMEAGRQLREFAVVADKKALEEGGDGVIYLESNLSLKSTDGVYAITAKDVEDAENSEADSAEDAGFNDLLGLEGMDDVRLDQ